jgi:spore coat protein H
MKKNWIPYLLVLSSFIAEAQLVTYSGVETKDSLSVDTATIPVIKISSFDSIRDEPKSAARLTYSKDSVYFDEWIGIEWRGNSALKYPKKSYDLEIWKDTVSRESRDLRFVDLREDDDWILNSLYNEPIKLRSYFSNKLWLEMAASRDTLRERTGKAGIDAVYVEVFLNDRYEGVYLLSEQVDRKLLDVKKLQGDTVRGLIYKAGSYAQGTTFKGIKTFNNAFPHWAGFEMDYPYENYDAHWEYLYEFVDLVVNSDDKKFASEIVEHLDLDNAIDYFIFINLLRATDNMGKNYFLACKDAGAPFYFVPWDLDGVLGSIQDGKRIPTTNDILSNGLFDRLLAENPANYRNKLTERWKALRSHNLETEKLMNDIRVIYDGLASNGLYDRDSQVWPMEVPAEDHLEYLLTWLINRLEFLDGYFGSF